MHIVLFYILQASLFLKFSDSTGVLSWEPSKVLIVVFFHQIQLLLAFHSSSLFHRLSSSLHSRQHDWLGWQSIRKAAPSREIATLLSLSGCPQSFLPCLCSEILLLLSAFRKSATIFTAYTARGIKAFPLPSTVEALKSLYSGQYLNTVLWADTAFCKHPHPKPLKTWLLFTSLPHPYGADKMYGLILFTETKSFQRKVQWCGKASSFRTHPFTGVLEMGWGNMLTFLVYLFTVPERLDC